VAQLLFYRVLAAEDFGQRSRHLGHGGFPGVMDGR
jgi:hypothetical protein